MFKYQHVKEKSWLLNALTKRANYNSDSRGQDIPDTW